MIAARTDWYEGCQKPERVGVYERADYQKSRSQGFSHWDGKWWAIIGLDEMDAMDCRQSASNFQDLPWRGLAADPQQSGEMK